ncbi:hypothetical protein BDV96DRAFT_655367 [Lophiotrema nucula]|uniref:Uncharacterized protein n=1 Tax=Lophiotrema nucula TaxID=690887 RepID=A0A6A5YF64_9PLEO|nr:hypothetical protein BDV96DRAFT_655367 [Lophiotrema nucula]
MESGKKRNQVSKKPRRQANDRPGDSEEPSPRSPPNSDDERLVELSPEELERQLKRNPDLLGVAARCVLNDAEAREELFENEDFRRTAAQRVFQDPQSIEKALENNGYRVRTLECVLGNSELVESVLKETQLPEEKKSLYRKMAMIIRRETSKPRAPEQQQQQAERPRSTMSKGQRLWQDLAQTDTLSLTPAVQMLLESSRLFASDDSRFRHFFCSYPVFLEEDNSDQTLSSLFRYREGRVEEPDRAVNGATPETANGGPQDSVIANAPMTPANTNDRVPRSHDSGSGREGMRTTPLDTHSARKKRGPECGYTPKENEYLIERYLSGATWEEIHEGRDWGNRTVGSLQVHFGKK